MCVYIQRQASFQEKNFPLLFGFYDLKGFLCSIGLTRGGKKTDSDWYATKPSNQSVEGMGRQRVPEMVALNVKSSEYCCLSPADLGVREDSVGCMSAKVILVEGKPGLME